MGQRNEGGACRKEGERKRRGKKKKKKKGGGRKKLGKDGKIPASLPAGKAAEM